MTPAEPLNTALAARQQQTAVTCYLNALVAIAKCMAEVCPEAGLVYSQRLQRLPRRLAFDATPAALEQSREALEADLAEYAAAAAAWLHQGSQLARDLHAVIEKITDALNQEQQFHAAMIDGLADQMEASAEIDHESQLRPALKRYSGGLRSYVQRRNQERAPALDDLQRLAANLQQWASGCNGSARIDELTGLLTRAEAEKALESSLKSGKPFCLILFQCDHGSAAQVDSDGFEQILKEFADRLANLVRPRDVVCRWSPQHLAVLFECNAAEAQDRAAKIAGWLAGKYSVALQDKIKTVDVQTVYAVVEPYVGEAVPALSTRIDAALTGTPALQPI